ncbi:MAG: hypothetical protein J3R72DRAFT_481204 [Linnemannia gamsii]|nr:MAG: hypothetical protein J3R72DRAFT_481204 [Linnemannia gamsii]
MLLPNPLPFALTASALLTTILVMATQDQVSSFLFINPSSFLRPLQLLSVPYPKTDSASMPVNSTQLFANSTQPDTSSDVCAIITTAVTTLTQVPWANLGKGLSGSQVQCFDALVTTAPSKSCGITWASKNTEGGCNCCWRSSYPAKPSQVKTEMSRLITSNPWNKQKIASYSNVGSAIFEVNCKGEAVDCRDYTTGWNGPIYTANTRISQFGWDRDPVCGRPSVC